jgi:hypothetical protein
MNFIEAISSHPHLKGGLAEPFLQDLPLSPEGMGIVSLRLIGGRDDEGLVASKISDSYPDSATPLIG